METFVAGYTPLTTFVSCQLSWKTCQSSYKVRLVHFYHNKSPVQKKDKAQVVQLQWHLPPVQKMQGSNSFCPWTEIFCRFKYLLRSPLDISNYSNRNSSGRYYKVSLRLQFHDSTLCIFAYNSNRSPCQCLCGSPILSIWAVGVWHLLVDFCHLQVSVNMFLIVCFIFQKCFFPDRHFIQHWLSTAARLSPCLSLYLRSGNAGHIGLFLQFAGWCVYACMGISKESIV